MALIRRLTKLAEENEVNVEVKEAAAITIAAPTAGVDDGLELTIISGSAFAHVITATGLLKTGSTNVNVATFAAQQGASLTLVAYNALWYVKAQNQTTFT